jgi:hypothetical protein
MFGIIRSTAHEISVGIYKESLNIVFLILTLFENRNNELLLELMHSLET